jgi:formylglycine-generating enzyme required for sulfatase activity
MALVPPACFIMGNDQGRRDERPAHEICLDSAFWIGVTEVTNAQYGSDGPFPGANRPRSNVTWVEARDFCVGRGMRLPSEAEWELAARGPDSLLYPWGSELIEDNLVFDRNSGNQTAEVGSKPDGVSWVGALDMSGNVLEWTSTIYESYPYDPRDGREDPLDLTSQRVQRSGWGSYIDLGASTPIRFRAAPDARDWFVGFRCARDFEG